MEFVYEKVRRVLTKKDQISMNWELQFLGEVNNQNLYNNLFEKGTFGDLVPEKTVKKFYNLFIKKNPSVYAHPISMLLALGQFKKNYINSNPNTDT